MYHECERYSEGSTCNKRKVGAALILPDDSIYYATNGSVEDPCTRKGPDYCIREQGPGPIEYFTCQSPCAEGAAMLKALGDSKPPTGGIIVTTYFPCERCTALIIDSGISELYFGGFKNNESRPREWQYQVWMTENGVSVNQLLDDGIHHYDNRGVSWTFRQLAIRTTGVAFVGSLTKDAQLLDRLHASLRKPE